MSHGLDELALKVRQFGIACASLALAVGVACLAGWATGASALRTWVGSSEPIRPVTILSTILLAAAILAPTLLGSRWVRAGRAAALVTVALAVATLSEYVTGRTLGVDQLFLHAHVSANVAETGRRSATGALMMVALGLSTLLLRTARRRAEVVMHGLAMAAALGALLGLIGYASGTTSLYATSGAARWSFPSVLADALLVSALLLLRSDTGLMRLIVAPGPGGRMARSLVPTAVLIPIVGESASRVGEAWGVFGLEFADWLVVSLTCLALAVAVLAVAARIETIDNERVRAEEALQLEQRRVAARQAEIESFYVAAPTGMGRSCNRIIVDGNPALCRMLGYPRDELVGMESRRLYVSEAEAARAGHLLLDRPAGEVGSARCRLRRKDGTTVEALVTSRAVPDDESSATFTFVVVDMTEQVAAEAALRDSERQFRLIAENSPDLIFRSRLTPPIVDYISPAIEEIGFTADEIYADPTLAWNLIEPEDATELLELLATGEPITTTVRWTHPDGALHWSELRTAPFEDEQGRMVGVEGIVRDVTEAVGARNDTERTIELLRRSNAERAELAERLAHVEEEERRLIAQDIHDDSIQVITALALRLDLLADRVDDPELMSALDDARATARAAINRLRDLLFELDSSTLRSEGLPAALSELLELVRQDTGATVHLETELTVPPPPALAGIAYRIATEALVNARKYAHAEHIDVRVESSPEALAISVVDDGRGFEDGLRQHGHLGLVSMRDRAASVGGTSIVTSVVGEGTTVDIRLPMHTMAGAR